jgi:hypothetical protein
MPPAGIFFAQKKVADILVGNKKAALGGRLWYFGFADCSEQGFDFGCNMFCCDAEFFKELRRGC